jgi:hypothetical protein
VENPAKSSPEGGALNGGVAMLPNAASNSLNVTEAPIIDAMKAGEASKKGGDVFGSKLGKPSDALASAARSDFCLVVNTDDLSAACDQVRGYLSDKQIAWSKVPAANTDTGGSDVAFASKLRAAQVRVRGGAEAENVAAEGNKYDAKSVVLGGKEDVADQVTREKTPATREADTFADADKLKQSLDAATTRPAAESAQARAGGAGAFAGGGGAGSGARAGQIEEAARRQFEPQVQMDESRKLVAEGPPTTMPQREMAFYCPSVPTETAHELESVLSARPGQMAQVVPPTGEANRAFDIALNKAATALPTTQSSAAEGKVDQSQTLAPDRGQLQQSQAQQVQTQYKGLQQQPAQAQSQDGAPLTPQIAQQDFNFNNATKDGFPQQQAGPPAGQQAQAPQGEKTVGLLILVRCETPPTTQPTAAEPVRPEPVLKAP